MGLMTKTSIANFRQFRKRFFNKHDKESQEGDEVKQPGLPQHRGRTTDTRHLNHQNITSNNIAVSHPDSNSSDSTSASPPPPPPQATLQNAEVQTVCNSHGRIQEHAKFPQVPPKTPLTDSFEHTDAGSPPSLTTSISRQSQVTDDSDMLPPTLHVPKRSSSLKHRTARGGNVIEGPGDQNCDPSSHPTPIAEGPLNDAGLDLTNTTDVDVTTRHAPAVTHETIRPHVHQIVQEEIHREIHTHEYHNHILPVYDIEVLPPQHFVPDAEGNLVQIAEHEIPSGAVAESQQKVRTMEASHQAQQETLSKIISDLKI